MTLPEIKSADQIKFTEWELREAKAFNDVLKLFDVATVQAMQARERSPEMGFTVRAQVDNVLVELSLSQPPRVSGGGYGKQGPAGAAQVPPKFDKGGVEAVLMANQEHLNFKQEGDKLIVSPKKFLGDLWSGINVDLKKYGMSWVKDGKNGRWEGGP